MLKKGLGEVVWQSYPYLSLMVEAVGSSETFFHFYHSKRRHIPEHLTFLLFSKDVKTEGHFVTLLSKSSYSMYLHVSQYRKVKMLSNEPYVTLKPHLSKKRWFEMDFHQRSFLGFLGCGWFLWAPLTQNMVQYKAANSPVSPWIFLPNSTTLCLIHLPSYSTLLLPYNSINPKPNGAK